MAALVCARTPNTISAFPGCWLDSPRFAPDVRVGGVGDISGDAEQIQHVGSADIIKADMRVFAGSPRSTFIGLLVNSSFVPNFVQFTLQCSINLLSTEN